MKYKLLLVPVLLITVILNSPTLAVAQTPHPEMKVTPAFNGYFKYGEWLPLHIELENPGQDIDAIVRVRVQRNTGGVTFTAPVSLPSGAHKRITLYILPNNFSHSLDVELVQDKEVITTQKTDIHPIMNINVFIGLAATNYQALSLLKGIEYPNNMRPVEVMNVPTEQFPERIEGLRSIDVLVFNDIDTSKLSPKQVSALHSWVHAGGRLVIGGGAGASRTLSGLPEDLLPVKLVGEQKVAGETLAPLAVFAGAKSIPVDNPIILSKMVLTNGASLVGDSDLPLIGESQHGLGFVDFVALDLSSVPFDGWSNTVEFWEALLKSREDYFNAPSDLSERSLRASNMIYPLSNIPSMEIPSIKWLAIILGIYIIIIGPVNYLVLKKKNRLHLAWVTIPSITLLFSAAAFSSGYLMRGTDILIHKIGIVEIQTDESAQVSSYMGLFSPSQRSYQVEVPGSSLLSPIIDEMGMYSGSESMGEITLIQGDPFRLKGLTVNQWSMQSFMTEQTWTDLGTIYGDVYIENGRMKGKVINKTTQTLKDVTIIMQSQFQRLGDLTPGQEAAVNFDLSQDMNLSGMPAYFRIFEEDSAKVTGAETALIEFKRSVLSTLFDNEMMFKVSSRMIGGGGGGGGPVSEMFSSNDVMVFGWSDEVPPDITVSSEKVSVQSTGLVYTYLDFSIPTSGKIDLPPGILQGNIIETDAGTCGTNNSISLFMDRNTMAQIEYVLPPLENVDFSELNIQLRLDVPGDVNTYNLSLYDWQAKQWTRFKNIVSGTNIIQQPVRFIDNTGKVQVQLENGNINQMGGCIYLDLGFKGFGKGESK